jgi:hypothetical protein
VSRTATVLTSASSSTTCAAGQITEYFGDHFGAMTPGGIAAGPDGNLWFTDSGDSTTGGSRIGKMSTDGNLIAFYNGATDPHVYPAAAITAGPDGNMWFIDTGEQAQAQPNLIGKITPDGVITEYSTGPDPTDDPGQSIVTGADGNLWFPKDFVPGNPQCPENRGKVTLRSRSTRPVVPHDGARLARSTGQIKDTRRVEPLWEVTPTKTSPAACSQPHNTAARTSSLSRFSDVLHSCWWANPWIERPR